jgi:uncharacterized membrane protein YhaH (DUF805 family)
MELQKILFSFNGRIGRGTYWVSILALIVGVQFLTTSKGSRERTWMRSRPCLPRN